MYWNQDKQQKIGGVIIPAEKNAGNGNGVVIDTVIACPDDFMRSADFVEKLNGGGGSVECWRVNPANNLAYPYFW